MHTLSGFLLWPLFPFFLLHRSPISFCPSQASNSPRLFMCILALLEMPYFVSCLCLVWLLVASSPLPTARGWYSWGTFPLDRLSPPPPPGLQLKRLSRPKSSGVPHCHLLFLLAWRSMVGIEVHPSFVPSPVWAPFSHPNPC